MITLLLALLILALLLDYYGPPHYSNSPALVRIILIVLIVLVLLRLAGFV
jgi:hypothetical protein